MKEHTSFAVRGHRSMISFGLLGGLWIFLSVWSMTAAASGGVSPFCPTQTLTVSKGGSVTSINLITCDGDLNIGMVAGLPAPQHGSIQVSPQSGPGNQTVTYIHNGDTASSDMFGLEDQDADILIFNVTILPATSPVVVSPGTLPATVAGTPFSQLLTSSGGVAPYVYTLHSGAIPVGLSLSGVGMLSGAPSKRGGYSFSVRSTDHSGQFQDKGYTGTVLNPTLSISPSAATAVQGIAFSQALTAHGGVAPHSYQLESGSLPAGISISSAGVVSGTTAAAVGNYPVTLRVTDSSTGPGTYFEVENFALAVSPPHSVSIAVAPASVHEDGAANLVFTVTRSFNLSSPTVVNITDGGTATSGSDYTGGVATVSIPGGATTATIIINPTADTTVETNETVSLAIAAGTDYTVGAPATATGTILNDDVRTASIAVAPAAVAEDDAANLIYTVTLSQSAATPTSVNFTLGGTATNGNDYGAVSSPLVIASGSTAGTITINPTADAVIEADETVSISLGAGTGYSVGAPSIATGTILDDEMFSDDIFSDGFER